MDGISFWNNWAKPYKNLLWMLLALLAGSILYFIASMWLGAELVIDWQSRTTLESVQLPLFDWQHPLLNIQLQADSYLARQIFWGSELSIQVWPAHLLLVLVVIALSVALAVVSSLRRFWYIAGMALFCGIVVSLRLEQLMLFGRIDKTGDAIIFLLFLPLSYYYQAIRPGVSLTLRSLSFLLLFVLVGLVIYFFSSVAVPFLYVANYGLPVWLGLSFLFIILVAPEIISGILYLTTASNTENSRSSLMHFTIASLAYFINLLLYYLENRGLLDLGWYYISPFYILLISMLIAFWTLRNRFESFGDIVPYQPLGALLYLSLAIICLGTLGYVFSTANDPLIETFEDAILYTHMGLGFLFFLFIVVNYLDLLQQNKRVYWVLYKPRRMPLFTARLAGIIAVLGLYSFHGMYALYQPMGGYYNGIGDLYTAEENFFLAEQYYKLGSQHKYANHRSNYALASLAQKVQQPVQAMLYLKEGIERQPTPYAYANLANLYFENNLYFDGLFILREGIEHFPAEGRLYNNLGAQFGRTNVTDSALYYLERAQQDGDAREAAYTNELAVLARQRFALSADSLEYSMDDGDIFYQNNLLALYNQLNASHKAPSTITPRALQELGGIEAAWLLNYALLKQEPDSAQPRQIRQLIDSAVISNYEEPALLAYGLLRYRQENHFAAFEVLRDLAYRSDRGASRYYELLGAWALEQRAPLLAVRYFRNAVNAGGRLSGTYLALALAEAGKPLEASEAWLNVPDENLNQPMRQAKQEALRLLNKQDFSDYPLNPNEAAYKALRWQWGRLSPEEENAMLSQIRDQQWKRAALGWLAEVRLRKGNVEEAEDYFEQMEVTGQAPPDSILLRQEVQLRQRLAALQGVNTPQGSDFIYKGQLGELYASATLAAQAGNTEEALRYYRVIMQATPFLEEAYLQAVPLLNEQGLANEAYDFLLKAIQFNPYAVHLKEQYIMQCLRLGLEQYAEDELNSLRQLVEPERFDRFLERYEQIRRDLRTGEDAW